MAKRHDLQKMAAFNLGVSEAIHQKKKERDTDFHVSGLLLCSLNSCPAEPGYAIPLQTV